MLVAVLSVYNPGEKKLHKQLEATKAKYWKFIKGLLETQNCIERLKKQRESFIAYTATILRYSLKTLDKLDIVEEAEVYKTAS
ncbi:hypothetical protein OIDMADRAFT_61071 [Oidiodendron maius Zn]|uniref:Uncharacterized protein n=1 Tax=Oidiodendron maius (strain Zn) TaxID=913774 RepID=A0A0C3GVB1_OIDMZ|nr:hypothetical protein OIDMADRAFT_61071 [Oidiodendron maius Zn]